MANKTSYSIEVVFNGQTLYYRREVGGASYAELDLASSTQDFAELGRWEAYVKNDLANNSIASYQLVEVELKATAAPGLDAEIKDAVEAQALAKLTQLEKDALGL